MYNNNYNARVVPEFMAYGGTPVGIPTGAVPQNATGGAIPQWALGQQKQNQDQPQPTTHFAQNNTQANDGNLPYIFSEDMRNRLGSLESNGNYSAYTPENGGIGALGKYQIRAGGLIDTKYLDKNYNWLGKNNINSQDDFFNNHDQQEQILDEYMKSNYGQLKNKGALGYIGSSVQGLVNNFNITDTGLLAASHREGAGAVNQYLNHLEKNPTGQYYMNYDRITQPDMDKRFRRIETRLRIFEK